MEDLKKRREQLRQLRADLAVAEAAQDAYEKPEAREQRELARAEYAWVYLRRHLTPALLDTLAELAGDEKWLFTVGAIEGDEHQVLKGPQPQ